MPPSAAAGRSLALDSALAAGPGSAPAACVAAPTETPTKQETEAICSIKPLAREWPHQLWSSGGQVVLR